MERLKFKALLSLVKQWKDKKTIITFHSIGDTDSVSSAFGLLEFFTNARVVTPDAITSSAQRILVECGYDSSKVKTSFDDDAELVILVDVNNFQDCGSFKSRLEDFKGNILIIDHHYLGSLPKEGDGRFYIFDEEWYNSSASIVYDVLRDLKIKISAQASSLLLAGIISDSANFQNATSETFVQVGELMSISGLSYSRVLEMLEHVSDPVSRARSFEDVAQAKVEIIEFKGPVATKKRPETVKLLYVHGDAHAHANIAADAAIKLGADVVLFKSIDAREVSYSARLRSPLDKKNGIHLGRIMKSLAPLINGNGGGHPCAAGAYGPLAVNSSEFEKRFVEEITKSK